ncbi:MAG: hypothetical protein ACRDLV_12860 [Solirubrobacteraceae bacterium]
MPWMRLSLDHRPHYVRHRILSPLRRPAAIRLGAAVGALAGAALALGPLTATPALAHTRDSARHHRHAARHSSKAPTPRQIARAVAAAKRSDSLWATINVCDSGSYRNSVGVRGQMPALGFESTLSLTIQIEYWSRAARGFVGVPGSAATATEPIGRQSTGRQQAGAIFPFRAHAGLLAAIVTFTWSRDGSVIGQARRWTTAGHPNAAYGSPTGYTAASCRIR